MSQRYIPLSLALHRSGRLYWLLNGTFTHALAWLQFVDCTKTLTRRASVHGGQVYPTPNDFTNSSNCSERYTAGYCGDVVSRIIPGGCRVAARTALPPRACPGAES